jgi:hypothetical protein
MFGVAIRTWTTWEQEGRVRGGRWAPCPGGKPGRCKVYAVADLLRLREEFRRLTEPYPDPDRPGCYRVPLAGHARRREAIIDAEDLRLVEGRHWNWQSRYDDYGRGAEESAGEHGYVVLSGARGVQLRRIILGVTDWRLRIRHANGNALDCRRENLVVLTIEEQARGVRKKKSVNGGAPSSRFKGVTWHARRQRWVVHIGKDGKSRNLGCFWNEITAAQAYDQAARELFGTHAWLNFPDSGPAPEACAAGQVAAAGQADADDETDAGRIDPSTIIESPPPDAVRRHEAALLFDVSLTTWTTWEHDGRVRCGKWYRLQSGGYRKVYSRAELLHLREEFRRLVEPYPDPDRPGCYRVPLASQVSRREAIIDAEDLPVVQGRNWNWDPRNDGTPGCVILASATLPNTPLRRMILGLTGPEWRVSHANGDPLDCRRANLVVRTINEQVWGSRKMGTVSGRQYTSKFKGVSWDRGREKWVAQIRKDGKGRHLGRFGSETAAAEAYDQAARELFGPHARLNFPYATDTPVTRAA